MGHLTELRKRITYSAIVVLVFVIGAFIAKEYVFSVVMYPLRKTNVAQAQELLTLGVTEAFMQVLKVSIYAGLICALPFLLYQFWAFILPGLYENEKKAVFPYVSLSTILFLGGIAFGYFIVLPIGLRFMMGYGSNIEALGQIVFDQRLQAERYISFVSMFELAFGIVFELPLVMMLLAWAGVDHRKMVKYRKYAILIEAVIAMVLTPSQDPVSMALMLVPLIVLYEFGILLARVVNKRRRRRQEAKALAAAEGETQLPPSEPAPTTTTTT